MKQLKLIAILFALVLSAGASQAMAQSMTGGLAAGEVGSYSSSSLQLSTTGVGLGQGGDGTFSNMGEFLVESTGTVTGLSATPLTLTTPVQGFFTVTDNSDLISFELTTLSENTSGAFPVFSGAGILTDSAAAFSPTDATFTLSFSGSSSNSFSLDTVATPEPASWMLGGMAALAIGILIRRRRAVVA